VLNATKSRKFSFITHGIFRGLLLLKVAPTSSLLLQVTLGQCCSNSFQRALAAHSFFFRKRGRASNPRLGFRLATKSRKFFFVALRTSEQVPYLELPQTSGFSLHYAIYPSLSLEKRKNLGKNCEVQRKRRVYFRCTSYFRGYINLETSNQPKNLDSSCI
jgi:hypothetical protein